MTDHGKTSESVSMDDLERGGDRGNEASTGGRRPLVISVYPGGKMHKLRWIKEHLVATRRYVEGFAGNATVLLNRPRAEEEILIEKNPGQANLLRAIRDHPGELMERLRPLRWDRLTFLDARWLLEEIAYDGEVARAALHYTVLKQSFGGQGRSFNFDFDHDQQLHWDTGVRNLATISDRLRGVQVIEGDALDSLAPLGRPDTLFFLDPPYVQTTRSTTQLYGIYEMTDAEHRALCYLVRRLEGKVILSGYPNPIYDELLSDWRQVSRASFLLIQRSKGPRKQKTEALWKNF
jgi:DNA adenine methylase